MKEEITKKAKAGHSKKECKEIVIDRLNDLINKLQKEHSSGGKIGDMVFSNYLKVKSRLKKELMCSKRRFYDKSA